MARSFYGVVFLFDPICELVALIRQIFSQLYGIRHNDIGWSGTYLHNCDTLKTLCTLGGFGGSSNR